LKPSGKGIAIFAAGMLIGLVCGLSWSTVRPQSSLTKGLPSNWDAASAQFDARLRARFPVGTPVWDLATGLEAEGFQPSWSEVNGEYGAKRDESDLVCRIAARAYWRVGPDGGISAIRGLYREEGCP
jgi:hypothetical protein